MKNIISYIVVAWLFSLQVSANERGSLRFSYWSVASAPFVILGDANEAKLQGGLIKDLGDLISSKVDQVPSYVNVPVARIENMLQSGDIDIDCITNPIWKESPDEYHWSSELFKGADRFLVQVGESHNLQYFEDLKGKSLGVYNGYVYHQTIMDMISDGDINAVKVNDIDHGINLLQLGRIDALIDFDILLNYKLKNAQEGSLVLADLYAERYGLFCAYSKKMAFEVEKIDQVLNELISSGQVENLLNQYK